MPIQLPSEIVALLPLALSIATAVASMGLTCSLLGWAFQKLPKTSRLRSLLGQVANWQTNNKPFTWMSMCLWLSVTCLHVLAWQLYLIEDSTQQFHRVSYFSSLLAILLGWQLWNSVRSTRLAAASSMTMQVGQILGLACCANLVSTGDKNLVLSPPGTLVTVQSALTDAGSCIPLYDRQIETQELETFYKQTQNQIASLSRLAMQRSDSKSQVNCHGWVFTGQHIIKGENVPTILNDNGYEVVETPQLNDLVIYTDANGDVLHTGIVCGFIGADQPLIESKWGIAPTFVHLADEQPYSSLYKFYRSPRSGHRLRAREPSKETLASLTTW